tara:strand:+ start:212 stop:1600 length:1389 start_codon:yes stop_codon:yes gene_type:complete
MKRRKFLKKTYLASASTFVVPTIIPSGLLTNTHANSKINIGQIGCGRIARFHDIPGVMKHDNARVVAVCDVDNKRLNDARLLVENFYNKKNETNNFLDIKTYDNYNELLENKDVDAVVISTPDHWHAQPAIEASLKGKDVYLQKPTSLTVSEGRILSDIIKKNSTILQVGTQQRSMPQFRIAAELVRNGRIGELHTVKVGLPGDPSGPVFSGMPVPKNLNYDMWLGQTPHMDYTEIAVHPTLDYSRPGWLRIEQFGSGMITGWGQHHYDSAAWGMNTELTGPKSVEAVAEFPKSGLWNVHGDFMSKAEYENGVTMFTSSGGYTNGIKYIGTEGWIFVSRGNYTASASDPVSAEKSSKALDASDKKILNPISNSDRIHLYKSDDHHGNWLDCIVNRKTPISTIEVGHRVCTVCLITHISMKLNRRLYWNPQKEQFINDDQANNMLSRSQRKPYGTNYVKHDLK